MIIEEDKTRAKSTPDNLRLRGGIYYADFRLKGRRIRGSLETGVLALAKQRLRELVGEAHSGDLSRSSSTLTLKEWSAEYVQTHLRNRVPRSFVQSERV